MKRDLQKVRGILERMETAEHAHLLFAAGEYNPHTGDQDICYPDWNDVEVFHIRLLVEDGLVRETLLTGEPWQDHGDSETRIRLTSAGYDRLAELRKSWLRKQLQATSENIITILIAVLIALASAWLIYLFGPPSGQATGQTQ